MKPAILEVTARIRERSAPLRSAYLSRIDALAGRRRGSDRLGCANVAHAFAGLPEDDKFKIVAERVPNLAVVNAYNDMLSAHQPYEGYPALLRDEARRRGATAQVAGGVPAMCDGVTQGLPGMELSLFSRDTIAMGTAIALTHDVFDGALLLGICDKIVPGLLIGALHFGHLPCVFVPAGPMSSGLSNTAKSQVRQRFAQGQVGREELLAAETAAYHGPGTCTFYGTANSNQMLLEAMGLHVPGAAFIHPHAPLREALTREAVRSLLAILPAAGRFTPIGRLVDERVIVNAMVALVATGGSTNHLIHWVAVARSAGILIDWSDFADLSHAVPLVAHVYPNGKADVNQFQAAGGPGFVIRELLDAGCMHPDVATVAAGGLDAYAQVPEEAAQGDAARQQRHLLAAARAGHDRRQRGAHRGRAVRHHRRAEAAHRQPRPGGDQGLVGARRPPRHRGAGDRLRQPGGAAAGLPGGRARARFRRRGALPGSTRQRHARTAQAHAAAGGAAGQGIPGGAGHRRPHERRVGAGAGCRSM